MLDRGSVAKGVLYAMLLGFILLGLPAAAWASDADEERAAARSLAQQGLEAFEAKRFEQAVDLFERAETLVHSPVHLLFIARASSQVGSLVKAQEAYIKISREELSGQTPQAFQSAVESAKTELEALKPRIPHVTVTITGGGDAPVELKMNEEPVSGVLIGVPMPVDPGTHTFRAFAEGMASESHELAVAEGIDAELTLELVPTGEPAAAPAPPPAAAPVADQPQKSGGNAMRYVGYAAIGVGAVGVGLGTVFLVGSLNTNKDADDAQQACEPCSLSEREEIIELDDKVGRQRTAALVSYVAGGIGIGVGAVLLITSGGSKSDVAVGPVTVRPWASGNAAGISGTF